MARIPQRPTELRLRPGRLVLPGLILRREGVSRRRERVTPFLVLQLTQGDMGVRPVMQAPLPGMRTLEVAAATSPGTPVDFDLKAGTAYVVSGTVTNLGRAPALLGLARLYVLTGAQLMANWGKPFSPYDVTGFSALPGRRVSLTFRREWVAPQPKGPSERISVFIHVGDMSGDRTSFVVANGHLGERRIVRDDFRLLP